MAKTKVWTGLEEPSCPRTFADGDAADWCHHAHPGVYTSVTYENRGTGYLYVSRSPALRGVFAATQDCLRLVAGEKVTLYTNGQTFRPATPEFSTFGADGAAHPMGLLFEAS